MHYLYNSLNKFINENKNVQSFLQSVVGYCADLLPAFSVCSNKSSFVSKREFSSISVSLCYVQLAPYQA
jgi:hypothetical protein